MVHVVEIKNHTFLPDTISIKAGDEIIWRNLDTVRHSARRNGNPAFNTGFIRSGEDSAAIAFDTPNLPDGIRYFCEPHPQMIGTILVSPADDDQCQK